MLPPSHPARFIALGRLSLQTREQTHLLGGTSLGAGPKAGPDPPPERVTFGSQGVPGTGEQSGTSLRKGRISCCNLERLQMILGPGVTGL